MKSKKGGTGTNTVLKAVDRYRYRSLGASPRGWFSVYVGPQREKFLARTEWLNHPLFIALLDDAKMEYGYAKAGPLELPCDVNVFHKVLGEVVEDCVPTMGCNFGRAPAGCFGSTGQSRPPESNTLLY